MATIHEVMSDTPTRDDRNRNNGPTEPEQILPEDASADQTPAEAPVRRYTDEQKYQVLTRSLCPT